MCKECYVDKNRITPLLNPAACLKNHLQYISFAEVVADVSALTKTLSAAYSAGNFLLNP